MFVTQQSHELGDADRRMRVVQVNGNLLGQIADGAVLLLMMKQDILKRRGDEEVFLPQAQFATSGVVSFG